MALLKVNRAEVHFLKPSTDPDYPWIVLCYDPTAREKKWVVWFADDAGKTSVGIYLATLDEARTEFASRATGPPAV